MCEVSAFASTEDLDHNKENSSEGSRWSVPSLYTVTRLIVEVCARERGCSMHGECEAEKKIQGESVA